MSRDTGRLSGFSKVWQNSEPWDLISMYFLHAEITVSTVINLSEGQK